MEIEALCSKNYFKTFLPQEARAFGNKRVKEPQKPSPKFKNMFIMYLHIIFALRGV